MMKEYLQAALLFFSVGGIALGGWVTFLQGKLKDSKDDLIEFKEDFDEYKKSHSEKISAIFHRIDEQREDAHKSRLQMDDRYAKIVDINKIYSELTYLRTAIDKLIAKMAD